MALGVSSILVISDSHGNMPALKAVLGWACKASTEQKLKFDSAIFLGDGADDLAPASAQTGFDVPWYIVRGNVDTNFSLPGFLVLETFQRRLFLAHGNIHGVNEGVRAIAAAAESAGAEAALFGHTHTPHCSMQNGIFLLNPGSIGRSRSDAGPTFAVLECPDSAPLRARFFHLVRKDGKIDVEEMQV